MPLLKCPVCGKRVNENQFEGHLAECDPQSQVDSWTTPGKAISISKGATTSTKSPVMPTTRRNIVIIDGNNVAYSLAKSKSPELRPLLKVRKKLIDEGYEPVVVVSAALRHRIDDRQTMLRLIRMGAIEEAEPGMDDDIAILERARQMKAQMIISNDSFQEYTELFSDLIKRVKGFSLKGSEFFLH